MACIYSTRQSLRLLAFVLGSQFLSATATRQAPKFTSQLLRSSQFPSTIRASSGFSVSFPDDLEPSDEVTPDKASKSTRKLHARKSPSKKTKAVNTAKDNAGQKAKEPAQLSPDSDGSEEGAVISHAQATASSKHPPKAGEELRTTVEPKDLGSRPRSDETAPKREEPVIVASAPQPKPVSEARKARRARNAGKIRSRKMDKMREAAQVPAKPGTGEGQVPHPEEVSLNDIELKVLRRLGHVGGALVEDIEEHSSEQSAKPRQQKEKPNSGNSVQEKQSKSKPRGAPVAKQEEWGIQKGALKEKFDEGWQPRKKLSPDTIDGIRALNQQYPEKYTTPVLAEQFKVSPEAIRRILKSKWRAAEGEMEERRERWARRYDRIWDQQAAIGLRPPRTKDRKAEVEEFALDQDHEARPIVHVHG